MKRRKKRFMKLSPTSDLPIVDRHTTKRIFTISLDNPNNPYYAEGKRMARTARQLINAPSTHGTLGGVHILKPINRTAAGTFQTKGKIILRNGETKSDTSTV